MTQERDAQSIADFCAAHGFSRATYYNLPSDQRPREIRVGSRVFISREAAADWRRDMEDRAAKKRESVHARAAV